MKPPDKKKAVALRYRPARDTAPRVMAKGQGYIADKIIELAREHRIPMEENPDLVEILSKVDLFAEIPPDVYAAVAQILGFVYRLKGASASSTLRSKDGEMNSNPDAAPPPVPR